LKSEIDFITIIQKLRKLDILINVVLNPFQSFLLEFQKSHVLDDENQI